MDTNKNIRMINSLQNYCNKKFNINATKNKVLENVIYGLALILSLQARWIIKAGYLNNEYLEYNSISLYLSDIVLLLILVITAFRFKKNLKKFKKINLILLFNITGINIAIFLSIFLTPDKALGFYKYGIFILGVLAFFTITYCNYNRKKFINFLLAGALLQASFGIWQFFAQSSFANKWLGVALHDITNPGTSVIETITGERFLRAYGAVDHPNILGIFLSCAIILALIKNPKSTSTRKKILLENLMISVMMIALIFSFSRAAWVGFIFGLIYLILILIKKKEYQYLKLTLRRLIMPTATLLIAIFLMFDLFSPRINTKTRLEEKSITERTTGYNEAILVINKNIFFGIGFGNYSNSLNKLKAGYASWYYQPVHNAFLLICAEIGLIGLLFFLSLLMHCFQINKNTTNMALIFPIVSSLMLDHWLWSLHFGILLFWVILGSIYKETVSKNIKEL